MRRVYAQYLEQANPLRKWVYLANLRDRNEVLFYRLLTQHLSEMLPVVYTPTVGSAIERFSHEFRRPRASICPSIDPKASNPLSVTPVWGRTTWTCWLPLLRGHSGNRRSRRRRNRDRHRKLAVYTAAAGIHPRRVVPVVLDMGTENLKLLNDKMYLGERHSRVRDQRYDDLIEAYVSESASSFPARCCTARTSVDQCPPHPDQVRRSNLYVQRRYPGHRGDHPGRRVLGGARRGIPDP